MQQKNSKQRKNYAAFTTITPFKLLHIQTLYWRSSDQGSLTDAYCQISAQILLTLLVCLQALYIGGM